MPEREITVFYSWQSDLPNSTTRGLIQSSIEQAVRYTSHTTEVIADRDTQGVFGSPDIVETIFSKINDCDIFVADVSAVTTYNVLDSEGNPTGRIKATPNPNVLLELGYAVRVLGWENVICIMNDDYSNGGEIPFDIEHHRLTKYSLEHREKAEVRKELRDIIASTIFNVHENGRRIPSQFSNILVGTWKPVGKNISNSLTPYNVGESKQVRNYVDALLQKAKRLVDDNRAIELPAGEAEQDAQQEREENQGIELKKIAGNEYAQILAYNQLALNKWQPVRLQEEDKIESRDEIKKYLGCEVEDAFFEFGNLKQKLGLFPSDETQYDGTPDEQRKYLNYVELKVIFLDVQLVEIFTKMFDRLVLVPLAVKNVSQISDEDLNISVRVDELTADIVSASSERLLDDVRGFEGWIYEEKLVESFLSQEDTADIKNERDDRFWEIEDAQSRIGAQSAVGFWNRPEYTQDDYKRQLHRYVAPPLETDVSSCSFRVPALHAGEAKWLSHLIVLKPKTDIVKMTYTIRSSKSNGDLNGELKVDVSNNQ